MAKNKKISTSNKRKNQVVKQCFFDKEKKEPYFADTEVLRRFVTERGKIVPRSRSGICAKHQKKLSLAIKHSRHLALIPFIGR